MRLRSRRRKHGRRRVELGEFCDRCNRLKLEFGHLLDLHERSLSVTLPFFGKLTSEKAISTLKSVLGKFVNYGKPCKSCAASESDISDRTRS